MATYSSQSPLWSCCCCCCRQLWWSGPHRPPPPRRDWTSLGWRERYLLELRWCRNFFELHRIILEALLSDVFVMKVHNLTSRCGSPPSLPGFSSTICTMSWSWCSTLRTPQGCRGSQRGSAAVSLWQQLRLDEEQDESLPGWGKGGIVQLAFAGKTLTSFIVLGPPVPYPPVIIKPAQWRL